MAQTLVLNYIHLIFSTKERENLILTNDLKPLFAYIAGTLNRLECNAIEVGGTTNHIHALCLLSKNIALKDMVRRVKSASSLWIKRRGGCYGCFEWQRGYGAFSLGMSGVEKAVKYIRNQESHHARGASYEDELREILAKYEMTFDEKYLI